MLASRHFSLAHSPAWTLKVSRRSARVVLRRPQADWVRVRPSAPPKQTRAPKRRPCLFGWIQTRTSRQISSLLEPAKPLKVSRRSPGAVLSRAVALSAFEVTKDQSAPAVVGIPAVGGRLGFESGRRHRHRPISTCLPGASALISGIGSRVDPHRGRHRTICAFFGPGGVYSR